MSNTAKIIILFVALFFIAVAIYGVYYVTNARYPLGNNLEINSKQKWFGPTENPPKIQTGFLVPDDNINDTAGKPNK